MICIGNDDILDDIIHDITEAHYSNDHPNSLRHLSMLRVGYYLGADGLLCGCCMFYNS